MALLLIDKNKNRAKNIRDSLVCTPIGLDIESFQSVQEAVLWAGQNPCSLVVIDQHYVDDGPSFSCLRKLEQGTPLLVLKNDYEALKANLDNFVHDVIGPHMDRTLLIKNVEHLLRHGSFQTHLLNRPEESLELYELALTAPHDGVWDWDLQKDEIFYSPRWCEIIGYLPGDLEHTLSTWLARVHPEDSALLDTAIQAHLNGVTVRLALEYRVRHKNGYYLWVLTRGQAVYDGDGKPCRLVGSQSDITERKNSEHLRAFHALHDPLTGLANQALLMERLQQIIIHHKRNPAYMYAVLFMDMDNFKDVNDNLGHEAGDVILKTVVKRLNFCIRQDDTLAHFGGDKFVILVAGTDSAEAVKGLAERILTEVAKPMKVCDRDIYLGISIGIVTDTKLYEDAMSSIRDADLALYYAKTNGRNRFELFNPSMRTNRSKHFALQSTLSGAKDRGELLMHYQPVVSLKNGHVEGFEALMRWQHPDNGMIYPLDFIPVAEETGLIKELSQWGIDQACQQLKSWQNTIPESQEWFMCVNVSGRQLENDDFHAAVQKSLWGSGLAGEKLIIELTENILMHDVIQIEPKLRKLKQLGVKLAIDDFGTGYSSLAVLNDFPFDILKIAREFVTQIDTKHKSAQTVKLIQLLANETHLKTIVEGIERIEEFEVVQRMGCHMAQGYLFSKPKNADDITVLLETDAGEAFSGVFKNRQKTA
jgi:diguanylate cyclase (GGDEF)-like protein/PAS domain S-box-containing protein